MTYETFKKYKSGPLETVGSDNPLPGSLAIGNIRIDFGC